MVTAADSEVSTTLTIHEFYIFLSQEYIDDFSLNWRNI